MTRPECCGWHAVRHVVTRITASWDATVAPGKVRVHRGHNYGDDLRHLKVNRVPAPEVNCHLRSRRFINTRRLRGGPRGNCRGLKYDHFSLVTSVKKKGAEP